MTSGDSGKAAREGAGKRLRQPLYAKVHETIRRGIADGKWAPGDSLPTEAELCEKFGVSRITVRHALQLLRQDGTITTHAARPAVVVSQRSGRFAAGRLDTLHDLIAGASDASLEIKSWKLQPLADAARTFGLLAATPLPCLKSLLVREREPFARSAIYFHPSVGSKLKRAHFGDVVVFRTMQRELGVTILDIKMTASAEAATAADAAELGVEAGSPMLCSRLVFRTERNAPVQISYTRYPADSYAITHTLDLEDVD